jgi:acyl dehydratase
VTLVRPGFNRLWAHPFLSLALVMTVTVRNPSLGQPSNRVSALGPRGLVEVCALGLLL